jgi:hypothetical protein
MVERSLDAVCEHLRDLEQHDQQASSFRMPAPHRLWPKRKLDISIGARVGGDEARRRDAFRSAFMSVAFQTSKIAPWNR